jgi:molecular chaperone Hsp33
VGAGPALNGASAGLEPPRAGALDTLTGFTLPSRDARGRIVRLGPTLATILDAHAYPRPLARLLAEALTLTALLGAMLRADDGGLTLQAQAEGGAVDLLVADWRAGALRGYLRHDPERLARMGRNPSAAGLFGRGYLALTLDQTAAAERYQGIVPLEGATMAEMVERYFDQSEQLPTRLRIAVDGSRAGGIIVQHLPRGEQGGPRLHVVRDHPDWSHVRLLADTVSEAELLDERLPLDRLLYRLFHEDGVHATPPLAIRHGCRCTPEHIAAVIARFPESERADMRGADGLISVNCEFCARTFSVAG